MAQATVTSKGQITIPAIVRNNMKVNTGDKVEFVDLGNGRYEVIAATRDVKSLKGYFKSSKIISIEEMNAAIQQEANK